MIIKKTYFFIPPGNYDEKYFEALLDATENVCYCRNLEIGTVVVTFVEKRQ